MDKYEQLQATFYQSMDTIERNKIMNASDVEIIRQAFTLFIRINRIEISNFIELTKAEGLLEK